MSSERNNERERNNECVSVRNKGRGRERGGEWERKDPQRNYVGHKEDNILALLGQIGGRDPASHPSILQDSQKMQQKRIFGSSSKNGGM